MSIFELARSQHEIMGLLTCIEGPEFDRKKFQEHAKKAHEAYMAMLDGMESLDEAWEKALAKNAEDVEASDTPITHSDPLIRNLIMSVNDMARSQQKMINGINYLASKDANRGEFLGYARKANDTHTIMNEGLKVLNDEWGKSLDIEAERSAGKDV
ncbi:hypothetical protein LJC19_02410 [Oxalobacter sp. OttesenSCG-928-P03]|nr:hypothetical protein [Oxalobacter sp. OttesenSCG-928-P03]